MKLSLIQRLKDLGNSVAGAFGTKAVIVEAATSEAKTVDEPGYIRVSSTGVAVQGAVGTSPDLPDRSTIIRNIRLQVRKNPYIQRSIITPFVSCLVGSGIKITTQNNKLKKVLDEFVKMNGFTPLYQEFLASLLLLEGELIRPFKVNKETGSIRSTFLYSDTVDVRWNADDNREIDWIAYTQYGTVVNTAPKFRPILSQTNKEALMQQAVKGGSIPKDDYVSSLMPQDKAVEPDNTENVIKNIFCNYVRINCFTTRRGLPVFYSILDFAEDFEEFMYGRLGLLRLISRYWIDVQVEGGDTEVRAIKDQYKTIPKSGTADIHNAKVKVETRRFNTEGAETAKDADTFLKAFDMTGLVPSKILSGEQPIEAGSMFHKYVISLQNAMKESITNEIDCLIEAKKAAGQLPVKPKVPLEYNVIFPEVSTKDVGKLATAVNQIALALLVAVQNQWMDNSTAADACIEALSMVLDTDLKASSRLLKELEEEGTTDNVAVNKTLTVNDNLGGVTNKLTEPIEPGGGAHLTKGSGNSFAKFTKAGEQINKNTKSSVTRT